jgi:methionyl-tRNA formyltransferase
VRILFAGSPSIAVPALEELFKRAQGSSDFELTAILTNPDSVKGRSGIPLPTETGAAAERLRAEYCAAAGYGGAAVPLILKPEKLDAAARESIAPLKPDLLVSFAYGRIFGPKFLGLFPLGGINIHPSLLPKYRGPTPIPAAILAGDTETGISIQRLAAEMDSGDILLQEHIPLNGRETTAGLSEIVAHKAAQMLPVVLAGLASGSLYGIPQNHGQATYCPLIEKEQGCIDWSTSAGEIDAMIRAFDPWPQSWTMHGDNQLFILKAMAVRESGMVDVSSKPPGVVLGTDRKQGILVQTGAGVLAVTELQYAYKRALRWNDFLNGARDLIGSRLGQQRG